MAIGRISGPMLFNNLERQGVDLAFQSNLLYLDVNNLRVGIINSSPQYALDSSGNVKLANLIIQGSSLSSNSSLINFTSDVSSTSNITAQKFYTVEGLFWSGNGNPFASGGGNANVAGVTGDVQYNAGTDLGATTLRYDNFTGNLVVNVTTESSSTTSGALVVLGGLGVVGNINSGNISATAFYWANGTPFASSSYSNVDVAAYLPIDSTITGIKANIETIDANVGAYQFYSNANIGLFQLYSNANAATQQLQIDSIDANLGSFQIYANNVFGTGSYGNTNVAAYIETYTGNLQAGNIFTNGNIRVTSNVFANIFYVTDSIRWASNGAVFQSGTGGGGPGFPIDFGFVYDPVALNSQFDFGSLA